MCFCPLAGVRSHAHAFQYIRDQGDVVHIRKQDTMVFRIYAVIFFCGSHILQCDRTYWIWIRIRPIPTKSLCLYRACHRRDDRSENERWRDRRRDCRVRYWV